MSKTGLLISRDLFFASKVTGTAQALGQTVRCIGPNQLEESLRDGDVGLVILDLECPGVTPAEVSAISSPEAAVRLIAFGPHVHEAKLAAAGTAGFHDVMPRSKFSANLPQILAALESHTN